mgnify:CR=1 FL=1
MSYERNLKYLNTNRIVYRRLPITDKPTIETNNYMFYEEGTHQCYELFRSSAKITTYKSDLERPPKNKLRKVIFKPFTGLTKEQKLSIVGSLIGVTNKIHQDDIYQCMIDIHDMNKKITIRYVSELLNVSQRTVHRHMQDELKREKELLNQQL